jgi:hypothetical protein
MAENRSFGSRGSAILNRENQPARDLFPLHHFAYADFICSVLFFFMDLRAKKPARWAAQRRSVTLEEPEDANLNPAAYEIKPQRR